jgi:2-dehydropantoate 2-reductase
VRIGVIGAGAIGGTIAGLLARAGHDVSVTARGDQLTALQERGLSLDGAWGASTASVSAEQTLTATPELVFVCTKAQDAAAAIAENLAHLAGIPVVIVQNGLEGLSAATALLTDSQVVGAIALYATSYLEPGRITVTAAGPTFIGSGEGAPNEVALHVAAVLGEAMPASAIANFTGAQWTKLIVNQVNAMPAITGQSAQETLSDPRLGRIDTLSMREAVRIGLASGIRFGSLQGLSHWLLRAFAVAPAGIGRLLPRLMARRMGTTPNPGSTLQSIRRGQLTEIDFLNGAVVRAAVTIGRHAPINATLTELVHRVEREGRFFDLTEIEGALTTAR